MPVDLVGWNGNKSPDSFNNLFAGWNRIRTCCLTMSLPHEGTISHYACIPFRSAGKKFCNMRGFVPFHEMTITACPAVSALLQGGLNSAPGHPPCRRCSSVDLFAAERVVGRMLAEPCFNRRIVGASHCIGEIHRRYHLIVVSRSIHSLVPRNATL